MQIMLIRHGETRWNEENRYIGLTDLPLSEKGRETVQHTAGYLKKKLGKNPMAFICSSPMKRALESMTYILKELELSDDQIQVHDWLGEFDFGRWEGLTYEQVKGHFPSDVFRFYLNPRNYKPTGAKENQSDFETRLLPEFKKVCDQIKDGETAMVVTHGGVIRTILTILIPGTSVWDWKIKPGSIVTVSYDQHQSELSEIWSPGEEDQRG
ncbi:phosphoglycerate mutase family protein [Microaerobacter geothermalis]|uniref:histidine phosphatase family protein n=1 Tax=Microaerobacter geothermalis TaxID=674972 RepID=UPI001F1D1770|nr:histidine phosphatase family protein [Microaerobacter geothermalis]MCF6095378.1 phosphoglycerate mutase family protein [Microaerobacter geothermalis]